MPRLDALRPLALSCHLALFGHGLPADEWTAGRCLPGRAAQIHAAVLAAAGHAARAARGGRRRHRARCRCRGADPPRPRPRASAGARVRVLLVVRDPAAFTRRSTSSSRRLGRFLGVADAHGVGGAGDRRRFFANAVRASPVYAAGSVPGCGRNRSEARSATTGNRSSSPRPGPRSPSWPTTPRQRWRCAPPSPPADRGGRARNGAVGGDPDRPPLEVGPPLVPQAQEEALLCLLLRGPRTIEDAVAALRRLPRFRARDEDQLRNIADWARRPLPPHRRQARPPPPPAGRGAAHRRARPPARRSARRGRPARRRGRGPPASCCTWRPPPPASPTSARC